MHVSFKNDFKHTLTLAKKFQIIIVVMRKEES